MASLFHLTHDRKCLRNIFLVEPSDVYRKDDNEQVIALVYSIFTQLLLLLARALTHALALALQ